MTVHDDVDVRDLAGGVGLAVLRGGRSLASFPIEHGLEAQDDKHRHEHAAEVQLLPEQQ